MTTQPRPQKLWQGELVDIDDDAYEAWIANGSPTEMIKDAPTIPIDFDNA